MSRKNSCIFLFVFAKDIYWFKEKIFLILKALKGTDISSVCNMVLSLKVIKVGKATVIFCFVFSLLWKLNHTVINNMKKFGPFVLRISRWFVKNRSRNEEHILTRTIRVNVCFCLESNHMKNRTQNLDSVKSFKYLPLPQEGKKSTSIFLLPPTEQQHVRPRERKKDFCWGKKRTNSKLLARHSL